MRSARVLLVVLFLVVISLPLAANLAGVDGADPGAENRDLALLELKRLTRCPPGYLRGLFDEFSSDYDQMMLDALGYRAHLHLRGYGDGEETAQYRQEKTHVITSLVLMYV